MSEPSLNASTSRVEKTGPHSPTEGALRAVDAAANRSREGVRVVEDFARFVLDDRHLVDCCKQLRHDLTTALVALPLADRLALRETQADVGTELTSEAERRRTTTADVLAANCTRLQEGLRSLEEFGKLLDSSFAAAMKGLRYRAYTLQRAVQITHTSRLRLATVQLYVLVDGCRCENAFTRLVGELLDAEVDAIQLRDKSLDDRQLLARARRLCELTHRRNSPEQQPADSRTLCLVNDRPDIARLARADGVHLGQDDLTVKDARTLLGPEAVIGVSTHSIEQARQAVLDGANYIGVGPTFPSRTKQFDDFPGLDFLRSVAAEISLPALAIGGITLENLPEVLATGVPGVAVGSAITGATRPGELAARMREALRRDL